jgi:hypothetical protein
MRHASCRRLLCLPMVLAALAGCKRTPAQPALVPDASVPKIANKTLPAPPPPSHEAELRSFLLDWAAAQNSGDFADYQAKYSVEFQGLDHTKKRAPAVKAAAWMKEQQRLFAKPRSVTIRDEQAQATGSDGELRFIRAVDSGTYHEEGERRLLLRREVNGWRITREEVLSSKVDSSRSTGMQEMAYALVWEGDVVLADNVGDAWVVGRPRLRDSESNVAVAKVDEKSLPETLLRWKRERLRLINASLDECQATVTGFEIIAHSEWDIETIRRETANNDRKAVARVWEAKHLLVAKLGDEDGRCEDVLLARPARLPPGKLYPFEKAGDEVERVAQGLFNGLPDVAEQTAEARSQDPDWDDPPRVFLAKAGKAGYFLSAQSPGPVGCGAAGFHADGLWLSPTGRPKSKWELVRSPDRGKALSPEIVFDDGTGTLRIVYQGDLRVGVLRFEEGKLTVDRELEVPYSECRC